MTVPIYPGSIWAIAEAATVREVTAWLDANVAEPLYVVCLGGSTHEESMANIFRKVPSNAPMRSTVALAVAFANDEDEMLYALRWPEHYRRNSSFQ